MRVWPDLARQVAADFIQQRDLGPRRIILRELADRIEQLRSPLVVKKFAGQRFLPLAQAPDDFREEVVRFRLEIIEGLEQVERTHRSSGDDAAFRRECGLP